MQAKRQTHYYLGVNFVGLLLFLFSVWKIAANIPKGEEDAAAGVTFFVTALPVLAIGVLLNLGWGVKALIDVLRRRDYSASKALGVAVSAWTVAVLSMRLHS